MEETIINIIKEHQPRADKMKAMYDRFRGDKLPINDRKFPDVTKINNKISNDYRGEIIESVTGYLFGRPISYQINQEAYGETLGNSLNETLDRWEMLNDLPDLDNETGKMASICGYGARLLYVDKQGLERAVNIDPWETLFITEDGTNETEVAVRRYTVNDGDDTVTKVEVYDNKTVTYYIEVDGGLKKDPAEEVNPQNHLFDYVPLIKFSNNDEELGDFEKVEPLIDAYDRLVSDAQNELEEFRQAYMAFIGAEPTPEVMQSARQTGGFGMPEGTDIKFITKTIDTEFIETQKKTLNDNIYKFSHTVNMAEEEFSGGQQSGESRKWKLLALENKAINKERKFTRGLREQFKVLFSAWEKKGIKIDYLDTDITFTRNTPIDMAYYATIIKDLKGLISDETLYSNIPFIDDAYAEINRIEEAMATYVTIPDEVVVDEQAEDRPE